MDKIRNVFIKQHQRGRWRYHWGVDAGAIIGGASKELSECIETPRISHSSIHYTDLYLLLNFSFHKNQS